MGWQDAPMVEKPAAIGWQSAPLVSATPPGVIPGGELSGSRNVGKPEPEKGFAQTILEDLIGAKQTVQAIGSGMIAGPVGAGGAVLKDIQSRLSGKGPIDTDKEDGTIASRIQAQPTSARGQQFTGAIGRAMEPLIGAVPELSRLGGGGAARSQEPIPTPPKFPVGHPKGAIARSLIDTGYKLTPEYAGSESKIAKGLSAWGGKIKTQQEMSAQNEEQAANMAAKDLGLPEGTAITDKNVKPVLAKYGEVMNKINAVHDDLGTADGPLRASLSEIGGHRMAVWAHEKTGVPPEYQEVINAVTRNDYTAPYLVAKIQTLRKDAQDNLGAVDRSKHSLGNAQMQAANSLEGFLERKLGEVGHPELSAEFRDARTMYAKAKDYLKATNQAGEVNVQTMAQIGDKKRLSGEAEKMAQLGGVFPKVGQPTSRTGGIQDIGVTDLGVSMLSPRPESALGAVALRPLARKALGSKYIQENYIRPSEVPKPPSTFKLAKTAIRNNPEIAAIAAAPTTDAEKEKRYQAWKRKQEASQ